MSMLEQRQAAGAVVEKQLIDFMMQYAPSQDLKVGDVLTIARYARRVAFEAFGEIVPER